MKSRSVKATIEERLSRLEGAYEHLATKSDIGVLMANIANLETKLATNKADLIKWMVGTLVVGIVATATIVRAIS